MNNLSLNEIKVSGRLVEDIKSTPTESGRYFNTGRIAVNRYMKEDKVITSFLDIKSFSEEPLNLKKGQKVLIRGKIIQENWKNQEGKNRSKLKIYAYSLAPTGFSGSDINQVSMSGRLVENPSIIKISESRGALRFKIAVNKSYQINEEWHKETAFLDVSMFGKLEYLTKLAKNLKKGKFVYVSGEINQSTSKKNGMKRSFITIIANQINVSTIQPKTEEKESAKKEKVEDEVEKAVAEIENSNVPF